MSWPGSAFLLECSQTLDGHVLLKRQFVGSWQHILQLKQPIFMMTPSGFG
jgi:hypothetical protein